MNIYIIGKAKDQRTGTNVLYAQISIPDYLKLVGEDFSEFEIQRRREKYKAYDRMKRDIIEGALLPSITLAVKPERVVQLLPILERGNDSELAQELSRPGQVNILDGLQRTYILNDILEEEIGFKEEQKLLVEFWLESNIRNLVYRIIVLNAGQKPMSMRHQIDLLFITLQESLQKEIPNLEIFTEKENSRRTRARKYPLNRIAAAYQCFITKSSEVERQNIVAQKLVEEDILDSSEQELGEQFEDFKNYLGVYADLDTEVCRIYTKDVYTNQGEDNLGDESPELSIERNENGINWFGSENVMNSFFAALSSSSNRKRVDTSLVILLDMLKESPEGEDPLALDVLKRIQQGFNPRKRNVGFATRKVLTTGFKEYFRDEGNTSFEECWKIASEYL
jgi:hypothetical protein